MVIDSDPQTLQCLEFTFQKETYEVQTAEDRLTIITLMQQFHPHVVILDIGMVGIDGYEICRLLKEISNVAIIILTAKNDINDCVKAIMSGADDYMVKPFHSKELVARIHA